MKKLLLFLLLPILAFTQDSWINIDVHTDDWPEETTWELVDSNDVAIASGGPYELDQTLYSETVELNSGEYYYFLFDSYGDGLWTGGYVEIWNSCDTVLFFHEGPFTGYSIEEVMEEGAEWQSNELIESLTIAPCAPPTEGCTDPLAINYDEAAGIDDGSCEFLEGCTDPIAINYDEAAGIDNDSCEYIEGCINENASNYNPEAGSLPTGIITPGSTCNLVSFTNTHFGIDPAFYLEWEDVLQIGARIYVGDNGQQWFIDAVAFDGGGCNSPTTLIYVVSTAAEADGNPNTNAPGGVNVAAVVGEIWQVDPCIFIYGCTNPTALNYNPEAGIDDGSCINIPGCTDPTAASYNPAATQDDGSCNGGEVVCTEDKTLVTVEIMVDQYGCETSWVIYDQYGDGTPLAEVNDLYCGVPVGTTIEYQTCINDNTNIMFWLQDSYGDGLGGAQWGGIDGTWVVYTECGDTISEGIGDFGELIIDAGQVVPCAPEAVEGCTDDNYIEFNPMANADDGSCLTERVFGCVNPDAFNYDENANTQLVNPNCNNTLKLYDWADNGWAGSFMIVTQGDNYWGPFTLESDSLAFETQIDLNTQDMVKAYFYSFGQSQQTSEQCRFEILNPIGDVVLEGGTNPYTNPILSYNQYGFSYQGQALCGNSCIPKVYGCLDDTAVNYDSIANTDTDPSMCYYNPGCTNEAYTEYYTYIDTNSVVADYDDGSCTEFAVFGCTIEGNFNFDVNATVNGTAIGDLTDPCEPFVFGCTDPSMFNYNEEANEDIAGLLCTPFIYGCTDSTAYNYDESANTENDSCEAFAYGCTDDTQFNYDPLANTDNGSCIAIVEGCTDSTAFNYDILANTDDASCIAILLGCTDPTALNYNELANTDDESCIAYIYGCTDETAFNYAVTANTDDGSCVPVVEGCTDPTQFNYDVNANTSTDTCIEFVYGCTDTEAFNYDELANTNVGCESYVYGCTDPEAFNYNPAANTDDESCEEVVIGCTDPTALNTDTLANTNSGCIYPILGCIDPAAFNYNVLANTDDGSCIEVVLGCTDTLAINTDTLANTNFGCIYPIYGCTDPAAFNYNVLANTDDGTCTPVVLGCTDTLAINTDTLANTNFGCIYPILGCTDPEAFNYDINANVDDDSCEAVVIGCTDPTALNYDELANTNSGCIPFIYGCTDPNAFNYDPVANTDNGTCIDVVIGCTDSTALNYNANANTNNGCIYPILGCTDEEAFNYNSNANTDDGSCVPVVNGCTDPTMWNYNEDANTENGSCIEYVYGCTDATAFNYDPTANADNGTCIPFIYGCTDPSAFNYNVDANTEDFSCIEVVIGCTDEDAINYDPLANTDSGACIDVLTGCTDVNAFNYSLTANTDDGSCVYDAGCSGGPGEPYWLPNECFAWVISIDDECCNGEWDSYCVELYNYCDLGWPIDLEEISRELIIYPNPVTNILNISKEIDIKLYDMVGNLVLFKEKTQQIDMTNLPNGIYNLNINYNNKNINNRIIKQ